MVAVLSEVDWNAEQATRQSVAVVVSPEHDSSDDDALVVLALLVVSSGFELVPLLLSGLSVTLGPFSSSTVGGSLQSLNIGLQGSSNSGRPGKL